MSISSPYPGDCARHASTGTRIAPPRPSDARGVPGPLHVKRRSTAEAFAPDDGPRAFAHWRPVMGSSTHTGEAPGYRRSNAMESSLKPPAKIEVKLLLHPQDHDRALAIARSANIAERDFFALAIHLGAAEILRASVAN
ncbi:hypothetical protein A6456_27535 [Paraburkholderia tropica]|nr:hypothetical protein A6456_27535 [Paraburkholderia tropica]